MGWIDTATNRSNVPDVAATFGGKPGRMRSLSPCPACNEERRGSGDPRGPVGVTPNGKGWKCFRCNAAGDVVDFVAHKVAGGRVSDLDRDARELVRDWCARNGLCGDRNDPPPVRHVATIAQPGRASNAAEPAGGGRGPFAWRNADLDRFSALLWSDDGEPVRRYLMDDRGFTEDTLKDWSIGAMQVSNGGNVVERWVTIPLRDAAGRVVSFRFRSVPGPCLKCNADGCKACKDTGEVKKAYRVCIGRPLPLFGADRLTAELTAPVVITEGEFDVLALYQYGVRSNVVSGTAGATANWPEEWLDSLEPYQSFVVAYDDDAAGVEGAGKVADKLGRYRCSRATFPQNDANDCLSSGVPWADVERCLNRSEPMVAATFGKADRWADDIEALINNPSALVGLTTGNDKIDTVLGGMRPGLWVVTGDTGHGKTTFATWLCYEQALRDVPALVTSFEQRPIGTVQKLMRADLGGDFTSVSCEQRAESLARVAALPLWILDHYGELDTDEVVEAIRFARRRYGVRVALIDHLGFLVRNAGDKERQTIEATVRRLALIAVNEGITIMLICHPNRTHIAQQGRVKIGHLKGASAIEQDSHVGLVVERLPMSAQRGFPATKVHVDKVRSEFGQPESGVVLAFDPLACVFASTWDETPSARAGLKPIGGS